MIVKQIDLQEALKLAANGHEVKIMTPSTQEPEKWTDYEPDTLQHMLDGCLFFRSEPAMEKPDFAAAVQDMTKIPPSINGTSAEPAGGAAEPPRKCVGTGAKRKQVDTGKLLALRKAGWSMKKIGEELGISEGSVWNYLNKLEEEKKDGAADA